MDKAQVFLVKENQVTNYCYLKRGQQLPDNCVISSKEGYPEHFMIVAGMTGRGPLPLIKISQNVKISGESIEAKTTTRKRNNKIPVYNRDSS